MCVLCCALCAVCGVLCVVCRVSCVVRCVFVGFALCVCVCAMDAAAGPSGIQPTSSVEALIKNSEAHVEEDADAHLLAACSQALIG